jgi:hypothetical protein
MTADNFIHDAASRWSPIAEIPDTWSVTVLEAHEPFLNSEKEAELKLGLSQTLVALVAEGVTDADRLRKFALERLPLTPHAPAASKLTAKLRPT